MADALSIVSTAYNGIKTALGAVQTFYKLRLSIEEVERLNTVVSALTAAQIDLMDVQAKYSAIVGSVDDLKKEVERLRAWDSDKCNYELKAIGPGRSTDVFVYSRKEGVLPLEPPHNLCANCYQNSVKSILQGELRNPGMARVLVCHRCNSQIYTNGAKHKDHR